MSLLREMNYLFDYKLKIKLLCMVFIIFLGSIAELLGVAIILPIIELATKPSAITTNQYCRIIMNITGVTDSQKILVIFIGMTILLYVVKNVYLAWMAYMMNRFSKNIKMMFSTRLMEAYMKQPYSYFLQKNTAEILRSVMNDTVNLYTVMANTLQIVSQGTTALLIIIFMACTNFRMMMSVVVALGVVAVVIILMIQKKMRVLGKRYQKQSAQIMQSVKQAFEGIKEVKIMNKEHYFISDFRSVFHEATRIELVYNLLSYIPKYVIETVCVGGLLGYLAVVVLTGGSMAEMIPQLSAFAMGAFKLLPCVNTMYNNITNVLYNKASIDLIYHDIREVENVSNKEIENGNVEELNFRREIVVDSVSFHYENMQENVFTDVSLKISKGESVAFVGESGSGKTTLVDVILGILQPCRGQVLVDGRDICGIIKSWHQDIGYIPQAIYLLDDSIRRNVAFGIPEEEVNDDYVWVALKEAKLYDFVKGLKDGLDTEVGEAGTRLSGGQRQRIGIARALYHNPDILVFDEATSALDTETEREVMEAIDSLHGAKTMIMIAHRLSTIENCDHVYRVTKQNVEQVR